MKRYQIKAKSVVSPAKNKAPSELEKARETVKQILEQEDRNKKKRTEKNTAPTYNLTQLGVNLLHPRPQEQLLALTYMMEDVDPKELCTQSSQKEKLQQQGKNLQKEDVASSIQVGAKGLVVEPLEKDNVLQPVQVLSEKLRVKTPRWQPPEGTRRCGHNCTGCSKKCAKQGLENCHNCHLKNNIEEQTGE